MDRLLRRHLGLVLHPRGRHCGLGPPLVPADVLVDRSAVRGSDCARWRPHAQARVLRDQFRVQRVLVTLQDVVLFHKRQRLVAVRGGVERARVLLFGVDDVNRVLVGKVIVILRLVKRLVALQVFPQLGLLLLDELIALLLLELVLLLVFHGVYLRPFRRRLALHPPVSPRAACFLHLLNGLLSVVHLFVDELLLFARLHKALVLPRHLSRRGLPVGVIDDAGLDLLHALAHFRHYLPLHGQN